MLSSVHSFGYKPVSLPGGSFKERDGRGWKAFWVQLTHLEKRTGDTERESETGREGSKRL